MSTGGNQYAPPCVRVSAGTDLVFQSNFNAHPLVGGKVVQSVEFPDPTNPITPTTSGSTATFAVPNPGPVPYYCDIHSGVGMFGAVFVE